MKVRLTKNRLRTMNAALAVDDVLYEKFRRLNEEVDQKWARIYRAKRVIAVYEQRGEFLLSLPILDVKMSSEGTRLIVGSASNAIAAGHTVRAKAKKKES